MADKVRDTNQFNQFKSKYVFLGNPETTRTQFLANVNRDTYASISQHDPLLLYNSVAMNQPMELTRLQLIKKMVTPLKKGASEGQIK